MTVRRVTIPASSDVTWIVPVPELRASDTRAASPTALRELETAFAPPDCPDCFRFVERAIEAISMALDEFGDEPPRGGPTD